MNKVLKKSMGFAMMSLIYTIVLYIVVRIAALHYTVTAIFILIGGIMVFDTVRGALKLPRDYDGRATVLLFSVLIVYMVLSTITVILIFLDYAMIYAISHSILLAAFTVKHGDMLLATAKCINRK